MGKILFIALLVAIVWVAIKAVRRAQDKHPPPTVEDMVRCAQCGVNLPRSESHTSDGNFYCSAEHLRLHR